jgi:arylsulfatase A-like enzyme
VRILYIDIDCLRPDHLGCYGYHRPTSPNIDGIAARGARFEAVYASDTPCLPSRTAMFSGRFGIHTGVVGHGGRGADPAPEGAARGFNSLIGRTNWMRALRDAGYHTATVSPFAERHGAHHFCANFNEIINTGRRGLESADEIGAAALEWLGRRGAGDSWFLHVNFWDPHTPYRAPAEAAAPFAAAPLPAWYDESVRAAHWAGAGPHSAREVTGFTDDPPGFRDRWPQQPVAIDSMDAARAMFDGYDAGIAHADRWVGQILAALDEIGVADECAILVSADHGENLGELNVYGDHQTADEHTSRVPFLVCWPGVTRPGAALRGLHYQIDLAATVIELAGGAVPANWDGESFAAALAAGADSGRDALILSQGAWTCQRSVRFRDGGRELLCIRTYHDGYHGYPETMLFDLTGDPHEQRDLAATEPALVERALAAIDRWHGEMMISSPLDGDPLWTVLREGGPKHVRGELPAYLERLRATGRGRWAELLERRHG